MKPSQHALIASRLIWRECDTVSMLLGECGYLRFTRRQTLHRKKLVSGREPNDSERSIKRPNPEAVSSASALIFFALAQAPPVAALPAGLSGEAPLRRRVFVGSAASAYVAATACAPSRAGSGRCGGG